MLRRSLAVLVSGALLSTAILTSAAGGPVTPTPTPASATAAGPANQPPLPPGPARIKSAQGLEDDDLGPGVIILSIAVATGLLVWMMFGNDDDDDSPSSTGT